MDKVMLKSCQGIYNGVGDNHALIAEETTW